MKAIARPSCHLRLLVFALAASFALACTTPESLMRRAQARGGPNEEAEALALAEYAADRTNDPALRAWALRASARLDRQPAAAIAKVGALATDPKEDATVRAWAAFALGEWRHPETIVALRTALASQIDPQAGYYVLESLAKVLPSILERPEENDRLVSAMNTFAAGQKTFVPDIYDLVLEETTNLPVLVRMLDRTMKERSTADSVYSAVYLALNYMSREDQKRRFTVRYKENETALTSTFDLTFRAATQSDPALPRLVSWYAGVIGDADSLAGLCAKKVAELRRRHSDPRLRLLANWSLARMDVSSEDANEALVRDAFATETDPAALRVLGAIAAKRGEPDQLQQALKIGSRQLAGAAE